MNDRKKKILLVIFGFLTILVLGVGISYAYLTFSIDLGDSIINSSCLKLSLTESEGLDLSSSACVSDEYGKTLTPYTFSITNTCEVDADYSVSLNLVNSSLLDNASKVKLYLTGDNQIEPIFVNKLPSYDLASSVEGVQKTYLLDSGLLQKDASKSYELRMWIDQDVTSFTGTFDTKIIVESSVYNSK